jgi:nucleoside-diphosphate-sugar epimerase
MKNIKQFFVSENETVKNTMRIIDKGAIQMAIVTDKEMKLLGVISNGDIRRAIIGGTGVNEPITKIYNRNPVSCQKGTSKMEIIRLLKKTNMCVPVIDKNKKVVDLALPEADTLLFLSSKNMKKKSLNRILVIGGGGYIGSLLVRRLLDKGYKVRVLDRFIYDINSLEDLNNDRLEIYNGDTRHIEVLTEAAKDVDAVVHLAELVGDPAVALNPKMSQEINYFATSMIASVCKYYQINRFVYVSSCSVYGLSTDDQILTEKSDLNPVSLYAKLKIESEQILLSLADENFSPTILRLATVFGMSYRPRFDLVVNLLTAKALKQKKITVFGGKQWRPFIHVKDVGKAILKVLEAPLEKVCNQIYNVGDDSLNYRIIEIGEIIKKEVPSAELLIQDGGDDARDYKVSFDKIHNELDFKIDINIKKGIKEIIKKLQDDEFDDFENPRYSNVKYIKHKFNI